MKLTLQYALFGLALLVLTSCQTMLDPIEQAIDSQCAKEIAEDILP